MERSKSRRDKSQGEIKSKELSKLRRDQSQGEIIKVKERSKSRRNQSQGEIKVKERYQNPGQIKFKGLKSSFFIYQNSYLIL